MALTVSLSTLRTRIRNRGEFLSSYITDAELLAMINASIAELWWILHRQNDSYFLSSDTSNVVSGTDSYALPSDFYQAKGVDLLDSNSQWVNVPPYNWSERNLLQSGGADRLWTRYRIEGSYIYLMPAPAWAATNGLRLWYTPTPTVLSGDSDTFDGIAGFDEWIVLNSCIMCCAKEGSDPSTFAAQLAKLEPMVKGAAAHRDIGEPQQVRDVYAERSGAAIDPDYWRP